MMVRRRTPTGEDLVESGPELGDDIKGDYSTLAQVRDPDGTQLTLATPPSRHRARVEP